jgi:hypothetical protein
MADADKMVAHLQDPAARDTALDALERHEAPIPTAVALVVAPVLVDLLASDATTVERGTFDRVGLLLARLQAEALPEPAAIYGAAFVNKGWERVMDADSVVNKALLHKPAAELTLEDARSYACSTAREAPVCVYGWTHAWTAAGYGDLQFLAMFMSKEPIASQKKQPSDATPQRMMELLLQLLKSNALPELAVGGAWHGITWCLTGRQALGRAAHECGIIELLVAHLNRVGTPADWIVSTRRVWVFNRCPTLCQRCSGHKS